jgi:Leucine-rich repeat (LRR) protein
MRIARDIAMAILHAATLEEFRPAGQSLVELPAKMPDFPVLRVLDLSCNQLRSLPAWVFDLPDLEVLNLKGNQLDFIPSAIHRLRQLKRLQVDHNPIQGLPNLPPGLQEVHANGCPIERFPESVLRCPGIELVEMKGCRLREIPALFSLPSHMLRLDLQGNFLSAFPHDLVAAAHIDDLRIHGNPFLEALGGHRFADTLAGFFADASKRQLPLPDRNCQLDLLLEDTVRAGLNTSSRLLDSLESPFAAVREKAHKVLPKVLENPFHKPLPEFVCLAGRFSLVKI